MKNTFKYIAAFVAFSAAALVSGLTASAQNLKDGTYLEENGIAYAKSATLESGTTNKYLIDLKTFVTGEVTQTFEVHPADIVLVLDVSGSMDENINEYVYTARTHQNITGGSNWYGSTTKDISPTSYVKYNDEYYQVYIGRGGTSGGTRNYFIYFTVNGVRHYINTSGSIVTEEPTNVTSNSTNLWPSSVTLYTRTTQSGGTKMAALKTAVKAFIDQIAHNDLYEDDTNDKPRKDEDGNPAPLRNQISIVKFGLPAYNGTTSWPTNETQQENLLKAGNHFAEYTFRQGDQNVSNIQNYGTTYIASGSNRTANVTEVLKEFTTTSTTTNVDALKEAVDGLVSAGTTAADYGMKLAYELVNRLGEDRSDSRKTIVFFTDGEPNHGTGFNTTTATSAISNSRSLKAITYTETYEEDGQQLTRTVHPSVFSVGLFSNTPEAGSNLENYMNYVSSNYPNATAYNNGGTKESSDYYMDASGGSADDLKKIFTAIAHSAGGTGNASLSGGTAVTVDVVSSSFTAPKNASDVTVLLAPCNGVATIDGKQYLTFGTAKAPSEYGFTGVTASTDPETNMVSTTGFDFSENWCGPDPTSSTGYHGYAQILRFVITVNEDAVGGPQVETNDEESGIYLDGSDEPLVKFNRPNVKIPVQIWIQKAGLQGEDSAVFTLARAPFAENFDPKTATWESITKIVIGPDDLDPATGLYIKKQVGLDPDYFYRIKEDAWAFGYQYQYGGTLYTVGDEVVNPFTFENTPKNKKFDEAQARNIFNEKPAEQSK